VALTLCVLLWAADGRADALAAYEDEVLVLLGRHGGRVVERVRRVGGTSGQPTEVQVLELPDDAALRAYLADPDRAALVGRRVAAVARTEVIPVDRVLVHR
jgi:uncharacterized protein (DUF1330 family)